MVEKQRDVRQMEIQREEEIKNNPEKENEIKKNYRIDIEATLK